MRRELASGTTLVVDRYSYSGVAFTSAKGKRSLCCRQLPRPTTLQASTWSGASALKLVSSRLTSSSTSSSTLTWRPSAVALAARGDITR